VVTGVVDAAEFSRARTLIMRPDVDFAHLHTEHGFSSVHLLYCHLNILSTVCYDSSIYGTICQEWQLIGTIFEPFTISQRIYLREQKVQ
jgi:hypothetical protein